MKSKITYIVIAVLAVGIGALFLSDRSNNALLPGPTAGEPKNSAEQFAGFSLKDYSGNTVKSSDFEGKPLVVNSWASWCPFCRQELPDFAAVQKEFGDRARFIAVGRSESLAVAKKYSDELAVTDNLILLLDPTDSFYRSIGGFSMPETIFVDANGNIVDHKRGPMDISEIRERTKKILN